MNVRSDAFYRRQSVDRKDSISIESQLEFSRREFGGESYREYRDKRYSGGYRTLTIPAVKRGST
jgi:hypothetical protein